MDNILTGLVMLNAYLSLSNLPCTSIVAPSGTFSFNNPLVMYMSKFSGVSMIGSAILICFEAAHPKSL